jgi:hypothetical protein
MLRTCRATKFVRSDEGRVRKSSGSEESPFGMSVLPAPRFERARVRSRSIRPRGNSAPLIIAITPIAENEMAPGSMPRGRLGSAPVLEFVEPAAGLPVAIVLVGPSWQFMALVVAGLRVVDPIVMDDRH